MNARQQELFEMQKAMLWEALQWIMIYAKEGQNPYDVEIPKDEFMARFSVLHHAGNYARERYFKDFMEFGVFSEVYDEVGNKKEGVFQVDYKELEFVAKRYGLRVPQSPQPKEQTQTPT
jgi:hypothetical protein